MIDPATQLARRRDKAIAVILAFKENECDQFLPDLVSARLRKLILDQINDICMIAAGALMTSPEDNNVILNEHYLQKIAELHDVIVGGNGRASQ